MVHVVFKHSSWVGWALRVDTEAQVICCLNLPPPLYTGPCRQGELKCDTMSGQLCVLYEDRCTEQNLRRCINWNRTNLECSECQFRKRMCSILGLLGHCWDTAGTLLGVGQ